MGKTIELIMLLVSASVKFLNENVRRVTLDYASLWADIAERGLMDPPMIHKQADGKYMILRGHRRIGALQWGMKHDPERFKAAFPDETFPCEVKEGLSEAEVIGWRNDHGNRKKLVAGEAYVAQCQLFSAGYTQAQVAILLDETLLDAFPPDSGTNGSKAIKMRDEANALTHKRDASRREKMLAEADKLLKSHYHGNTGQAWSIFMVRNTIAFEHIIARWCDQTVFVSQKDGKSYKTVHTTLGDLKRLHEAYAKDMKAEVVKTNKNGFGELAQAVWDKLVKKSKEPKAARKKKADGPTAMTGKQMEERKPVYRSEIVKATIDLCRGVKVTDMDDMDAFAALAEKALGFDEDETVAELTRIVEAGEKVAAENAETVTDAEAVSA